jgi:hypothetical protein
MHNHQRGGALDPETRIPDHDLVTRVRAHYLITVPWRHSERLDDRVVYGVQQCPNLGRSSTLEQVDV